MKTETITLSGLLCYHKCGEASRILYLSSLHDPLAEELADRISNKKVSVRYWITDQQCDEDEAQAQFLAKLYGGIAKCDFGSHYSELTGYLWTDEKCFIGGHNLISELQSFVGKWLVLQISIFSK